MPSRCAHILPILALAVVLATSAEIEHRVRLGVDVLPTDVEADGTLTINGFEVDFADLEGDYDQAGRATLQYSARIGEQIAAVLGGGLAYGRTEDEDGEILTEFGGIVEGGISVRLAPWFDLEAVVPFGFGVGDLDDVDSDEVTYVDLAVLLRPVVTIGERWQLFGQVGFIARRESVEYDEIDEEGDQLDVEMDIEQDGFMAGLGVGVVF